MIQLNHVDVNMNALLKHIIVLFCCVLFCRILGDLVWTL